jgi:hypothetical protein
LVGEAWPNGDVQKETDVVNGGLDQVENTEEIAVNDPNAFSSALAISDAVVDAEKRTEENTEDVDSHSNKKGKKAQSNSKKNRNVRRALVTVKNKIEWRNYLLLLEDNLSDLQSSGRKTTMNRKILKGGLKKTSLIRFCFPYISNSDERIFKFLCLSPIIRAVLLG